MAKVIKLEGTFKGFNIASSGMATIRFKAPYSEIATYVSLIGVQEKEVILAAKENENDKFQKIGEVKLKEIRFKGEDGAEFIFKGESMAIPTFNSFLDKTVIFAVKCEEDGVV